MNKKNASDITYWLSGLQPYQHIQNNQDAIAKNVVMLGFFAFALNPTIIRAFSAEKELFTLKADEVENFLTNLMEYGKARLKWTSKGGVANNKDFEDEIFDVYLNINDHTNTYIPGVILDYNDFKVIYSGCLKRNQFKCELGYRY